jgi:hypothetical protein
MSKSSSFNRQFLGGYFPQEHWDESDPRNGHEVAPPSEVRKRQGVAIGSQTAANPGMVGKADYSRKRRK